MRRQPAGGSHRGGNPKWIPSPTPPARRPQVLLIMFIAFLRNPGWVGGSKFDQSRFFWSILHTKMRDEKSPSKLEVLSQLQFDLCLKNRRSCKTKVVNFTMGRCRFHENILQVPEVGFLTCCASGRQKV